MRISLGEVNYSAVLKYWYEFLLPAGLCVAINVNQPYLCEVLSTVIDKLVMPSFTMGLIHGKHFIMPIHQLKVTYSCTLVLVC